MTSSPAPHEEDARDIRRVLAGDATAFEGIVARHGRRVYDLARRILRDPHEAEDAAQHAFLNAFKALERFDTARPFRNWILRITTNLCRNRLAARKVRAHELRPQGGDEPLPEPEGAPAPVAGVDPEAAASLEAAIADLPERYRTAVILRHVHGLPLEDISAITNTPVATVKTHLHRGRSALRDLLTSAETDPEDAGTEG